MTLYYVCVNVQAQSNGSTLCVWKIGYQIISKRERMIIVSFIPIMRQIASYANTVCLISLSTKVDHIHFWILGHFSHHMLSLSMYRCKITRGNFTNT